MTPPRLSKRTKFGPRSCRCGTGIWDATRITHGINTIPSLDPGPADAEASKPERGCGAPSQRHGATQQASRRAGEPGAAPAATGSGRPPGWPQDGPHSRADAVGSQSYPPSPPGRHRPGAASRAPLAPLAPNRGGAAVTRPFVCSSLAAADDLSWAAVGRSFGCSRDSAR